MPFLPPFSVGGNSYRKSIYSSKGKFFNSIALRKAKIVYNLGLSECNRVKE